jgi:hypothetical protein
MPHENIDIDEDLLHEDKPCCLAELQPGASPGIQNSIYEGTAQQ